MADCYLQFLNYIDVKIDPIAELMFQFGYVTFDEIEKIKLCRNKDNAASLFLHAMTRRHTQKQYDTFVHVLQYTGNAYLIKLFRLHVNKEETQATASDDECDDDFCEIEECGCNPSDVKIVMEQAKVTRFKAAKVLMRHSNNVVGALLDIPTEVQTLTQF